MVTWGGAFAPEFSTVSPPQLDPRVRSLDQAPARHVGRAIYTASLSLGRGMRVGCEWEPMGGWWPPYTAPRAPDAEGERSQARLVGKGRRHGFRVRSLDG